MILASFAEVLSIGAVLPFLGALTAPNRIFEHPAAQAYIQHFGLTSADQILLPITIAFGLAAIMAGVMRLVLLRASIRLSFAVGADLSNNVYRRTLFQPYPVHIARNSSEVINGISIKTNEVIFYVIMPALNLLSASVMLVAIVVVLSTFTPAIALVAFGFFGLIYALIIRKIRHGLKINSRHIAYESTQTIKFLQEGLGGIRDVLTDGTQATFCTIYRNSDQVLRRAQGNNQFMSQSPRYAMEAMGMVLIALLAYVLSQQADGIAKALPILAALAVGLQRLLPALQQAYQAWSTIHGAQASLQDALELLDQPLPDYAEEPPATPLPFQHQISLKQLSFRYGPQTPWVLKNIDLVITKGSCVGIIGTTGSGKSTLLDIIMGLLPPTEGSINIDGQPISMRNLRAWRTHIAHVPQTVFLADGSINENIAFGVPKDQIEFQRVRQAARQAQIADIIEAWPLQYQTVVGERGVQLSGGQRQRIGIARALYKRANVIIFDEATSALDNETEEAVLQAIELLSKDLTILIIAHRLTTVRKCTQIIKLDRGVFMENDSRAI
jgi:ATP-binding cassette subfamily B protein